MNNATTALDGTPLGDEAHARRTDPITSHEAAADASIGLPEKREAVLRFLRDYFPAGAPDVEWVPAYIRAAELGRFPAQSESGLRTRRAELVEAALVREDGEVTLGRRTHIRWRVAGLGIARMLAKRAA